MHELLKGLEDVASKVKLEIEQKEAENSSFFNQIRLVHQQRTSVSSKSFFSGITGMFKESKTAARVERDYYQHYQQRFCLSMRQQLQSGHCRLPDHVAKTFTFLKKPLPNILAFNLIWDENPSKSGILKVLLSIQERINIANLYSEIESNEQ